jgi:hypothetical protein
MTLDAGRDQKRMRLRYPGTCRICGAPLPAGSEAVYERNTKTVRCVECPSAAQESAADDAAASPVPGPPEADTAGASARREYERRATSREQRVRTAHPRIGGLILALSDEPLSTQAWQRGAVGEEIMAKRLKDLPDTWRVLHDRRIPGSHANIDHIAVGPTGVWVIDAKRYKGKRPALHLEGGIIRPRVESLRIGGRDGTRLVAGVQGQVKKVASALDVMAPAITGVLCFVEADWPLIGGSFTVNGIHVVWPRLLITRMIQAPDAPIDVAATHARLASHFPPA